MLTEHIDALGWIFGGHEIADLLICPSLAGTFDAGRRLGERDL